MRRTRLVTAGLSTVAVSSMIAFTASPATADDDRGCGRPAVPAVIETVVVEEVWADVPALTHDEWTWQRDVDVEELEYLRVLSPARTETDWSRTVAGPVELLFSRVVVDEPAMPAVPAVPATGHEEQYEVTPAQYVTYAQYEHQVTHEQRWERDDWGAQHGQGSGWVKTGLTRPEKVRDAVMGTRWVEDTPEIPAVPAKDAVTHVETLWAAADPGAPWTGPTATRPGAPATETTTTDGPAPAGAGWVAGATRTYDALTETGWDETLPAGTTATGRTRVARTEHEVSPATAAEAPGGDGWTKVDGSQVTITDKPAERVLVTPGSTTEVEVSPALPATEPCVAPPTAGTDATTGGAQAAPAAQTTVSPAAAALPDTGGVPWWMAPVGLAGVLAGAVAVRRSRADG